MNRMRLTIAVLFVVAFAAGVAVGLTVRQWDEQPQRRGSWLGRELDLTESQRREMAEIWSAVGRDTWRQDMDRRRALQRQRDQAIQALVPAEQQEELQRVLDEYSSAMAELSRARRQAFDDAVEKTKAILTPEQREKYESFLARRPRRPGGERRDPDADAPAPDDATAPEPSSGTR